MGWMLIEGIGWNQDRFSEGGTVSKRVPKLSMRLLISVLS